MNHGYRELLVWAEMATTELIDWQAYTYRLDHTIALLGSHDLADPRTIELPSTKK